MKPKSVALLNQFILYISLFTIVGCYEPIEDCLDLRANNYSLIADNACDDCCTFPDIELSFIPMWGDTTLRTDTIYTNDIGDSFSILSSEFLVSNIQLFNDEGRLGSTDSVTVECGDGVFYDSFSSVTLSRRNGVSRKVPLVFGFDDVQFDLGVNDCLAETDTVLLLEVLESAETFLDSRQSNQQFISAQMQLEISPDTLELQFINTEWSEQLNFEGEFNIREGFDLSIEILVDYRVLMQSVSLDQSQESVKNAIRQNLINAFALRN